MVNLLERPDRRILERVLREYRIYPTVRTVNPNATITAMAPTYGKKVISPHVVGIVAKRELRLRRPGSDRQPVEHQWLLCKGYFPHGVTNTSVEFWLAAS